MGSAVIVVAEPVFEGLVSGLVVGPGLLVGPFAFEGLVVSFYFAVLLGMIGLDRDMADTVPVKQTGRTGGCVCISKWLSVMISDMSVMPFRRKESRAQAATVVPFSSGSVSV